MRQLPPLAAVIAFEAAARHESFLLASAELSLTPSAISHQVKNLETWAGRRLFVRQTRRLALTEDGKRLLAALTPALGAMDDAFAALRPPASRASLSVHCAPSFAAKWLGPRLVGFMKAHPAVTIRLTSSAEPALSTKDRKVDVLIAYGRAPEGAGLSVQPLGIERTAPLCSPKLWARGRRLTPRALLDMVLIESQLNPVGWIDWCRHNGLALPRGARPSFDRGSLAVAAAVDGLGVALETTRFAEAELERGELIALEGPRMRAIERPLHYLCHPASGAVPAGLPVFKAWLLQELEGHDAGHAVTARA